MKITVQAQFAKTLRDRIFVTTGAHQYGAAIQLEASQLPPEARQAALAALVAGDYGERRLVELAKIRAESRLFAASDEDWSVVVEDATEEPTVGSAIALATQALLEAAERAPAVRAAHEAALADREALLAAAREDAIAGWARAHVGALLRQTGDEWRVLDNYDCARLGPNLPQDVWRDEPRLVALRQAAAAEATARNEQAAAEAVARQAAEALWVAEHLSEEEQARYREGVLPRAELSRAVHDVAFAALAEFARYQRLRREDVEHSSECYGDSEVSFGADEAQELSAEEYATVRRLREAAGATARVEAREHRAICQSQACRAPHDRAIRRSALVRMSSVLGEITREYALP